MKTQKERIEQWKQGLANAKARLANSQGRPDWIAYNKRKIAKYQKLLRERPELPDDIPSIPGAFSGYDK